MVLDKRKLLQPHYSSGMQLKRVRATVYTILDNETLVSFDTPIPRIARILIPGKNGLRENRVSGTVLMIQLYWNSPTCKYIGKNPRKWKLF